MGNFVVGFMGSPSYSLLFVRNRLVGIRATGCDIGSRTHGKFLFRVAGGNPDSGSNSARSPTQTNISILVHRYVRGLNLKRATGRNDSLAILFAYAQNVFKIADGSERRILNR